MSEQHQSPEVSILLQELGVEPAESRSILEQDDDNSPSVVMDPLHGDRAPTGSLAIQKEKPIHRIMGLMVTKGATYREIAAATGYTPVQVSTIIRQPWMRSRILKLIEDEGLDPVKILLQSAGTDSIHRLIELRDTAPPAVALGATKELLDRYLGKAQQHIIHENRTPEDPIAEKARLEKEIADMQKKLPRGVSGVGESVVSLTPPPADTSATTPPL